VSIIFLKEILSKIYPQKNLEDPFAIPPRLPTSVKKESSCMPVNPYYL
jgi:hypothetical protein